MHSSPSRRDSRRVAALCLLCLGVGVGCGEDNSWPNGDADGDAASGGQGAASTTGGQGGSGLDGGSAGSGASGGGDTVCTPGEEVSCYDGPIDTKGVGLCAAGKRICASDGSGFGDCAGQVLPSTETCGVWEDEDCDGELNEEGVDCECVPGAVESCYSGPVGTEGFGLCVAGSRTCNADGLGFGPCNGEVTPAQETCSGVGDEDCDGFTNEGGPDCACVPGSSQSCYSAALDTLGVGVCQAGAQICANDGLGYGPCSGEITPSPEICNTPEDEDCDEEVNEPADGCICVPGATTSCYTGPPGTLGVGLCAAGTATCNDEGIGYDACTGQVLPAFEVCSTLADEDCDGILPPCMGGHIWSRRFGDPLSSAAVGVETDPMGNFLVTGNFTGVVSFGGPPLTAVGFADLFIAKYDANGNHYWSKRFGDAESQPGRRIGADGAGNVYIGTLFQGTIDLGGGPLTAETTPTGTFDILVAKFDPNGNHVWSKRFGDQNSQTVSGFAIDVDGNMVFGGYLDGTVDFGGGPLTSADDSDVYLAKLDTAGNHVWSRRFGANDDQQVLRLALDAAGNVVIVGEFFGSLDFGGGSFTSAGSRDGFIAKLDAAGNHLWSKRLGNTGIDSANDVAVDVNGNVLVGGYFVGSIDLGGGSLTSAGGEEAFVAKFDAAGNHVWSKRFGTLEAEEADLVDTDAAGNVIVSGFVEDTIDLGGGPLPTASRWVAKLNPAGDHVWSKTFGPSGFHLGQDLVVDDAGDVVVVGSFSGTLDFGVTQYQANGQQDAFIVKLAQ